MNHLRRLKLTIGATRAATNFFQAGSEIFEEPLSSAEGREHASERGKQGKYALEVAKNIEPLPFHLQQETYVRGKYR